MQVQNYKVEDYPVLLAAQDIDASDGALFASDKKMKPNKTHRTIFIGIGGTGIQTLDYIKGVITSRLDPTWNKYIAFLGVDSAYTELDRAKYLQKSETVLTTRSGVDMRCQDPNAYPAAWRMFAKPEVMANGIHGMTLPGAGKKRLIGKLKIHDKNSEGAVDMEVVTKIAWLKANVLAPVANPGNYEVYVIGSVSGGTCSGSFLEMPSLIRKALNCDNVHVYAMLYLPDTLIASLDPANAAALMANGYASLKELNYYQGISMRPGYPESFGYNDPAAPELKVGENNKPFFDIPYLIGTPAGAAANSGKRARQNIAEYLISLLGEVTVADGTPFLTDDFLSNALPLQPDKPSMDGVPDKEAAGSFHEFPRHFGAIGFAQTAVPKKIVRAFVVSKACSEAGLKPVSTEKRAEILAGNPHALLPFRGADDLINANEGTKKASELLAPLAALLPLTHSAEFSFLHATGWPAAGLWQKITGREYQTGGMPAKIEAEFNAKTDTEAMKELETAIVNAYNQYLGNVKKYVSEEGPLAFYNLFAGRFIPVNGNHGVGIQQMLKNIQAGNKTAGDSFGWVTVAAAKSNWEMRDQAVVGAGLFTELLNINKRQLTNAWVSAYDAWQESQIIEKRREYVLGDTGKFHDKVLNPATVLAEQIQAFGHLLASMSDIYKKHGEALEDFDKFSKAKENEAEINLCAVSAESHAWLKREAQEQLKAVNAKKIRTALVDSFFEDINGWISIPDNVVITEGGVTKLAREGVAIPARKKFDEVLQKEVPDNLSLDIEKTFAAIKNTGMSYTQFANQVVRSLALASGLMFNGTVEASDYYRYLMYPNALKASAGGTAIANAIETAAKTEFAGIAVYASDDADSIKLYQLAAPFEVYKLNDLKDWEDNYLAVYDELLHGLSPDTDKIETPGQAPRYVEKTSWKDYPSIVPSATDPKRPDPATGKISLEGQIRIKLAALIKRAKELGVLFCKQENDNKYRVYRVNCDKSIDWKLDLFNLPRNELGLLPTGAELAGIIAMENETTLASISRPVELNQGGVFAKAHISEAAAWEYTERVLRAHMPMQIEVRNTVAKFEEWYKIIEEENRRALEKLRPAKMVFLIRSRLLYRDAAGIWKIKLDNGTEKTIANFSENGLRILEMTDPKGARLIKNGFSAYFLYTKLASLPQTKEGRLDKMYETARTILAELGMQGDEDALMAGIHMASFIDEETAALEAIGGALAAGEDANLKQAFVASMQERMISEATMKDVRSFYIRASKWAML